MSHKETAQNKGYVFPESIFLVAIWVFLYDKTSAKILIFTDSFAHKISL